MTNRPSASPSIQVENERVIVTEWDFAPGAETDWHRHQHDYVVVPQLDGQLLIEDTQGERVADLTSGVSYYRPAGVEHNVINNNDYDYRFVEIELK